MFRTRLARPASPDPSSTAADVTPESWSRRSWAHIALVAVAVAYVLMQFRLGALRFPLNLDEDVYASQFANGVARIPYAAHRSLGEGLLAAPLTIWTSSVVALRAYFVVLSGALLYLAFLPWMRVRGGAAVPVAAALFASTWVALRYGSTVLPNQPIAFGAIGGAGLVARRGRYSWIGLFVISADLTLVRPTDAVWILLPLLAALVLIRQWRSRAALAGAVAGAAVGTIAWVVEAYARFGGPVTRMNAIQKVNAPGGLHFALLRYLGTMNGRESCNPSVADCGPVTYFALLWWVGGLALVLVGLFAARRAAYRNALVLCVLTAAVLAAEYIFLSAWAVPRYLLPAFALLAIPAAEGVVAMTRGFRRPLGALVAVATAGALLVYGGLQVGAAYRAKDSTHHYLDWSVAVSDALAKRGVTGDCAVLGAFGPQIAYLRHCRAADMHDGLGERDKSGNASAANVLRLRSQGLRVIVVRSRPPATPGVTWWQPDEIAPNGRNRVYLDRPQPGTRPYAGGVG